MPTIFFQIKHMIQSSEFMGGSNLVQAATNNFCLIQFTAISGMKLLSCPYFVTTEGGQERKRATIFLQSDDTATCCTFLRSSI